MTRTDIQCRLEAHLALRQSLGFVTCYPTYALKDLLEYVQAKDLSWPIRPQTVLDWIAAAPHCGPAGQRARMIRARGFLKHLKASFPETEVPPPGILAPVIRPKPYLYTSQEIASLLKATLQLWPQALSGNSLPARSSACSPAPVCGRENPSGSRSMMSAWTQLHRIWRSAIPSSTSHDWCRSIPPRWNTSAAIC